MRRVRALPGGRGRRAEPAGGLQGPGAVQPRWHAAGAGLVGGGRRAAGGRALGHGVHPAAPATAAPPAAGADAALRHLCRL